MSIHRFNHFGDLYRAALAEKDPDLKQLLLADVKRVLDSWADSTSEGAVPPARRVPSHVASPPTASMQRVA